MSGSGATNLNSITATGTFEGFGISQTGTYFIAAFGAAGGLGGAGGEAAGDFVLTQGNVLDIAVGLPGMAGALSGGAGGGGGASFVSLDSTAVSFTPVPLVVAGGGGGDGSGGGPAAGEEGGATIGGDGQGGSYSRTGGIDPTSGGAGGGGFYGDGQSSNSGIGEPTGGLSFLDGATGGMGGTATGYNSGGSGGFGGGGGGSPNDGGGGGGYTGGYAGEGGSSYVATTTVGIANVGGGIAAAIPVGTPILIAGGNADADGEVLIEYLGCFLQGTRLVGSAAPVAVETLRAGDLLFSDLRGCAVPITWVGQRRIECGRHPDPKCVLPVCIRANAFGRGQPAGDLRLSPDHAVFQAGVLIPVRVLVNGRSVVQEAAGDITYWHVELDQHDIILAEGLPVESFLDTGGKAAFVGANVVALTPDFATRIWEAEGCAPLRVTGPEVEAVRAQLVHRVHTRRAKRDSR